MKVYVVYRQSGESYDMKKIFASESMAKGFVSTKNIIDKHSAHWFFLEEEVIE
jgi:hypothetical protein